jgi:hypothetical protein
MKPITFQFNEITRKEHDVKKLNKLKHLETKKSKELIKIKVLNGYVYTTRPEDYEHLKR